MTLWQPGMIITDTRLMDGLDPTVVTTGLVAATDFTVNDFYASKSGRIVFVHCYLLYSGATITATSGNISDTTLCTLPVGWRPPTTINAAWGDGAEDGECTIGTGGAITLRSSVANIPTARNFRVTANWNATS